MAKDRTKSKGATLLKMGRIREFRDWAMQQPMKFTGPCESEPEAQKAMEKLTRKRSGTGEMFYVEQRGGEWWIMKRLTEQKWRDWWELLGWPSPAGPGNDTK